MGNSGLRDKVATKGQSGYPSFSSRGWEAPHASLRSYGAAVFIGVLGTPAKAYLVIQYIGCAGHGKVLLGVVYCQAVADCASITDRSSLCPSLLYEGLVNLGYSVSIRGGMRIASLDVDLGNQG